MEFFVADTLGGWVFVLDVTLVGSVGNSIYSGKYQSHALKILKRKPSPLHKRNFTAEKESQHANLQTYANEKKDGAHRKNGTTEKGKMEGSQIAGKNKEKN